MQPEDLNRALREFRCLLPASGVLVVGFFGSDNDVTSFDHLVIAAYF